MTKRANRCTGHGAAVVTALIASWTLPVPLSAQGPMAAAEAHDPACDAEPFHAFDFWPGTWAVESRFLLPDGSWRETTQSWVAEKRAGGCVLVDYASGAFGPRPMSGMGTRYYDPTAEHWVITWLSTDAPGRVGRWTGTLTDGAGDFLSDGDGPLRTRIRWFDVGDDAAGWDYAVSNDGGENWTTQWTMDFERRTPGEDGR